jgi:hypothetical protein
MYFWFAVCGRKLRVSFCLPYFFLYNVASGLLHHAQLYVGEVLTSYSVQLIIVQLLKKSIHVEIFWVVTPCTVVVGWTVLSP